MKRIRRRVIILSCWLIGFCSAEQILEPVDISGIAYLFVFGMLILVFAIPRLARIPLWFLLAAPLPIFVGIKILLGSLSLGVTILEAGAVMLTTFLAYRVSLTINEFENAIAYITNSSSERVVENGVQGTSILYREVRRARNHQRPLSLVAMSIEEKSLRLNLDRIVQEAQLGMIKHYALSRVARLLCDRLEDCDIIVQNNEHFLILLPETKPEDLPGLIDRLRRQVSEQIGVEVNIGTASLPHDSYTLEGLIDQATKGIKMDLAADFLIKSEKMLAERQAAKS